MKFLMSILLALSFFLIGSQYEESNLLPIDNGTEIQYVLPGEMVSTPIVTENDVGTNQFRQYYLLNEKMVVMNTYDTYEGNSFKPMPLIVTRDEMKMEVPGLLLFPIRDLNQTYLNLSPILIEDRNIYGSINKLLIQA